MAKWLGIWIVALLTACSTTPPSPAERLQRETESLLQAVYFEGAYDLAAAQEAARLATLNNNPTQQWRALLAQCHAIPAACESAHVVAHRLSHEAQYQTLVTQFLAHGDAAALQAAQAVAESRQQHALLQALHGDNRAFKDVAQQDRALALYYTAKHSDNLEQYLEAGELFRQIGQLRGAADALFAAAKIAHGRGDVLASQHYAVQSQQLLLAVNRADLAALVADWLAEQP